MESQARPTPSPSSAPMPDGASQRWRTSAIGLAALAGGFIVLGHDGRRIAQLLLLLLPLLAWMAWPLQSRAMQWLRRALLWAWVMLFVVDGVARAYLLDAYKAAPDGTLVLGALANTTRREGVEYLQANWRVMLLWSAALAAAAAMSWRLASRGRRSSEAPVHLSRWAIAALAILLLLGSLAYASKPWRRLHPLNFWSNWTHSVRALASELKDQKRVRDAALAHARTVQPTVVQAGPSTVVLVISDSINRDNMTLYGYSRNTTPRLLMDKHEAGDKMLVLRNAWSVDASTLPALRNMMAFGRPDAAQPDHLLALARAAGYKVWWMSNHDDVAIEQQHARLADVVQFVNRTPGRSTTSLDGELLDGLHSALEDQAKLKFIVVHLLGAHPHYRLRFPAGQNPFDDETDAVDTQLANQGRPGWLIEFRDDYDAALLYHDYVVSQTLELTRTIGRYKNNRAWMYISDHGQEVGHVSDRAGHSPDTESGYRIPALVWRSTSFKPEVAQSVHQPFRADWAAWTVADLLHLQWHGQEPQRNVLSPRYKWQAPALPAQVKSFVD